MHPTFHTTCKIFDVGWGVGCICPGLYNRWFKFEYWKCPFEHTCKFTYLSPFTHPKLHWSHFNKSKVFKFSKTFETACLTTVNWFQQQWNQVVLKVHHKKEDLEMLYKLWQQHFSNILKIILERVNNNSYKSFENTFLNALNIYALLKAKILRFSSIAFITRKLRKEMKRWKLNDNFNKNGNHEHWCNYKSQRNYCVNLLRKSKKQYSSNRNVSDATDNKSLQKLVSLTKDWVLIKSH